MERKFSIIIPVYNRPQELRELCREAHDDMLPDDWRYLFIVEALEAIADRPDDDLENSELEPDIYNPDVLSWLSSRASRYAYVDDAAELWGIPEKDFSCIKLIQLGQLQEKEEVYAVVLDRLKQLIEDDDEEE